MVDPRYDVLGQDVEVREDSNVLRQPLRAILDMLIKARVVSRKTECVVGRGVE